MLFSLFTASVSLLVYPYIFPLEKFVFHLVSISLAQSLLGRVEAPSNSRCKQNADESKMESKLELPFFFSSLPEAGKKELEDLYEGSFVLGSKFSA